MVPVMCACGYAGKIPETFIGQKLRCPKCTNLIDTTGTGVPTTTGPTQPMPAATAPLPAAPPPPPAPPPAPIPVAPYVPPPIGPSAPPEPVSGLTKLCGLCKKPMRADQLTCLLCGARQHESESERMDRKILLEHESFVNEVNDLGKRSLLWSLPGLFCFPLIAIVAVVFGFQSIKRSREYQLPVNGMAIGGLVISFMTLSGWFLYFLLIVFSIKVGMKASEEAGEKMFEHMPSPPAHRAPPPDPFDERFNERDR